MTVTVNIVVVFKIPPSVSWSSHFLELFLIILSSLLVPRDISVEVSVDCVLIDIISLSLGEGCLALVSCYILSSVSDDCLHWNDCCGNWCSVLHCVASIRLVAVTASFTTPVVYFAIAVVIWVAKISVALTILSLIVLERGETVWLLVGHSLRRSEILLKNNWNLVWCQNGLLNFCKLFDLPSLKFSLLVI